jgi:tRNA(adenine34) deaminase
VFLAAGHRVVAPDLIGFGKSDKPKKDSFHTFTFHRQTLLELVERLDLKNVVLVLQERADLLGLSLLMAASERYRGLLVTGNLMAASEEDGAAYNAPFVDRGHRAALRAFPRMLAQEFGADPWTGQTLLADDCADQGKGIAAEAVQFFALR